MVLNGELQRETRARSHSSNVVVGEEPRLVDMAVSDSGQLDGTWVHLQPLALRNVKAEKPQSFRLAMVILMPSKSHSRKVTIHGDKLGRFPDYVLGTTVARYKDHSNSL